MADFCLWFVCFWPKGTILFFLSGCAGSLLLLRLFSILDEGVGCHTSVAMWQACGGPSPCRAGAQGTDLNNCSAWVSSYYSWVPEHRLLSCITGAQLLCGMWHPPGLGIPSLSPALAGRLLTTGSPGQAYNSILMCSFNLFKFIHSIY